MRRGQALLFAVCLGAWSVVGALRMQWTLASLGENLFFVAFLGLGTAFAIDVYAPSFAAWVSRRLGFFWGQSDQQRLRLALGQLVDLLRAGVPLGQALDALARSQRANWRVRHTPVCAALEEMATVTAQGATLGRALEGCPIVPAHWGPLLAAAEEHDALLEMLSELVESEPAPLDLGSFKNWLALVVFVLGAAFFVGTYLLPTFVTLFEGMDFKLPRVTILFLLTIRFLRQGWVLGGAAILLLALALLQRKRRRSGRLTRLPLQEQAVVARTLALCLKMGLPSPDCLRLAAAAVTSPAYRKALAGASDSSAIGEVLDQHPRLFEAPLRWLVRQGERMGNLDEALLAAAQSLSSRADLQIVRLRVALETGSVLLAGGLVAFLVFACYLPIVELVTRNLPAALLP